MYIDQLEINLKPTKDLEIKKQRAIDYTTNKESEVDHSIALSSNIDKRIIIDDNYVWGGITNTYPSTLQELTILEFQENYAHTVTIDGDTYTVYYNRVRFDDASCALLLSNKDEISVQKHGTGDLRPTKYYMLFGDTCPDVWFGLIHTDPPQNPDAELESDDKIFVGHAAYSETITDKLYLYDKWQRFGLTESRSWMPIISEIQHNVSPEPSAKIQGLAFGLLTVIDLFNFDWVRDRKMRPISLVQNLTKGITDISLIETKNTDTQDYE